MRGDFLKGGLGAGIRMSLSVKHTAVSRVFPSDGLFIILFFLQKCLVSAVALPALCTGSLQTLGAVSGLGGGALGGKDAHV